MSVKKSSRSSKKTPAKKAASKKSSAKKAAPKKTAGKKQSSIQSRPTVRVRNRLSSRTTNRSGNGVAFAYVPLEGESVAGFLDRHLADLKRLGFATDTDVQRFEEGFVADSGEMLERWDQDLAVFEREEMPIKQFHGDLLVEALTRIQRVAGQANTTAAGREVTTEDIARQINMTILARNDIAERGKACGIPVRMFDIRRYRTSGRTLHIRFNELLPELEDVLDQFDSPRRARELYDALVLENEKLGELVGERKGHGLRGEDLREDRVLVLHFLHGYLKWLSNYGKAAFSRDLDGRRRWRLDKTFGENTRDMDEEDPDVVPTPTPAVLDNHPSG